MRRGPLVKQEHIKDIISGAKTELRLKVKKPRHLDVFDIHVRPTRRNKFHFLWWGEWATCNIATPPFGIPEETRWIPETWAMICPESVGDDRWATIRRNRPFALHPESNPVDGIAGAIYKLDGDFEFNLDYSSQTWRSPAAMPQWASRVYVQWTGLRVGPERSFPQDWVYTFRIVNIGDLEDDHIL